MTAFGTNAVADSTFSGTILFSFNERQAGQAFDLVATCTDPSMTTAKVESSVLDVSDLTIYADQPGDRRFTSHGKVKTDAKPGTYKVSFTCGTIEVSSQLKIIETDHRASVSVTPAKARPGAKVSVRMLCDTPAPVTSAALTVGTILTQRDSTPEEPVFGANATVKNVKPGAYKVVTKCAGKDISSTFTVLGSNTSAKPQVPVKPKGAAETGDIPDA